MSRLTEAEAGERARPISRSSPCLAHCNDTRKYIYPLCFRCLLLFTSLNCHIQCECSLLTWKYRSIMVVTDAMSEEPITIHYTSTEWFSGIDWSCCLKYGKREFWPALRAFIHIHANIDTHSSQINWFDTVTWSVPKGMTAVLWQQLHVSWQCRLKLDCPLIKKINFACGSLLLHACASKIKGCIVWKVN